MKKLISILLAVMLIVSATVVSFNADTGVVDKSRCINFDLSSAGWSSDYSGTAYASPVGVYVYERNNGELIPWGSKKLYHAVETSPGIWSYDPYANGMNLQAGKQYTVIFTSAVSEEQTYDLLFDTSCLGDVAYCTGKSIENPVVDGKSCLEARWKKSSLGPELLITKLGNVVGETCPANATHYDLFIDFVHNSLEHARRNSGKSDQRLFDDIGTALNLTKNDIVKAINETGCSVYWQEERSSLPGGTIIYPKVTTETVVSGIRISWTSVEGANWYRVYYKARTGWKQLEDVRGNSFVDYNVRSGTFYVYTVRALTDDRTDFLSDFDHHGVIGSFVYAPEVNLTNIEDGVRISWEASTGAEKYRVFYYAGSGWMKLTDTTSTSVVDYSVHSGSSYTYTVRCMTADGTEFTSGYRTGKSIRFLTAPQFSLSNAEDGIRISWPSVPGAAKYRIYYYGASGWRRMVDTASTSYVDYDIRSGNSYTYTVRCITADGSNVTSDYRAGKSIRFLTAPQFSLSNAEDGIRISWPAVTGAAKYRIYYYGASGWRKMVDTYSTSYLDTDVRSGNSYTYTVRCLSADGSTLTSDYRVGKSIRFLTAPKFSLSNASNGINISWPAVPGAVKYRIFYYGASGWRKMVDTTSTSYLDTDVRSGNSYTYTVRCISADGSSYTSDYRVGKSIRYTPTK